MNDGAAAETGLAPSLAIPKALDRAGTAIGDVALWEINEAFASVSVAATRTLGLDEDVVNVLGSGCSLGYPVAMTGTRMVLTLIHELRRRGGGSPSRACAPAVAWAVRWCSRCPPLISGRAVTRSEQLASRTVGVGDNVVLLSTRTWTAIGTSRWLRWRVAWVCRRCSRGDGAAVAVAPATGAVASP